MRILLLAEEEARVRGRVSSFSKYQVTRSNTFIVWANEGIDRGRRRGGARDDPEPPLFQRMEINKSDVAAILCMCPTRNKSQRCAAKWLRGESRRCRSSWGSRDRNSLAGIPARRDNKFASSRARAVMIPFGGFLRNLESTIGGSTGADRRVFVLLELEIGRG